ncbi:hypothetical protein F5884DRAFT_805071 [Xylogone sp. PMI_703]|nr:hypothetical protein F5884DRAFT_805071 [Xylogone sp. PMI_703]
MVTGIEATGVILAVLPLVVNQVDAYIQGLQTLSTFRTRRYRRVLEGYSTKLGVQKAILLNTLEQVLEGVVEYEDDISELINNPRGDLWKDTAFQEKLSRKLDRNYGPFTNAMAELSTLLEDLSKKLKLESGKQITIGDATTIEREIKKFKDIFSKSIYTDLLSRIDTANNELKTLVEQSHHRQEFHKKRRAPKRQLLKYKSIRKHAANLYRAVTNGKYWNCNCRGQHCVHLRIGLELLDETNLSEQPISQPKFLIAFSTKETIGLKRPPWYWKEVEIIPGVITSSIPKASETPPATSGFQVALRPKVHFAIATAPLETLPWPTVQAPSCDAPISDFCSVLCDVAEHLESRRYLGSILDEPDAGFKYNMYTMKNLSNESQMQSLEELLSPSSDNAIYNNLSISRKARLSLAAVLAASVIPFYGSWLDAYWGSRDIVFPRSEQQTTAALIYPYIYQHALGNSTQRERVNSPLVQSEILFPLGLILVELSLCRTISALRAPEDNDSDKAVADLKTASRLLKEELIMSESGIRYEEVVRRCLFWPGGQKAGVDDDEFQQAVYTHIVLPLLDDLKLFQGKSIFY